MERDLVILLVANVATVTAGIKYLSTRVTRIERKLDNGLSQKMASVETRLNLMWDVCSQNPGNKKG